MQPVGGVEGRASGYVNGRHEASEGWPSREPAPPRAVPGVASTSLARPSHGTVAEKTLFQKIADRELPAEILFEDDRCFAIRDINPVAPTHILVVPREPVAGVQDLEEQHAALAGHLLVVARRLAEEAGLAGGYRLVLNVGDDAGQTVPHLHLHVLGGRRMAWPPG